MFTVNLKAVAGILGGAAAVTALITGAVKHFGSGEDTPVMEDIPPEQANKTANSLSCTNDRMESVLANEETLVADDNIPADADDDAPCCTSCPHSTCSGERNGVNLKKNCGYNLAGFDPAGHTPRYYIHMLRDLRIRLNDACRQINGGELRYAVYDTRTVMDEALRMVVNHSDGTAGTEQAMVDNLDACENRHLIRGDREFFSRLHRIRVMGNANGHRIDAEKRETGDKVCSAIMTIHELLNRAEAALVPE